MTKTKLACFTLDLESDGGWGETTCEMLENPAWFARFRQIIRDYDLKLTVFVVGKLLEAKPEYIDLLLRLGAEFELHSYSHDPTVPDSTTEIVRAKQAYRNFFGRDPKGYRAPMGLISEKGLRTLQAEGFLYDASILPSWRFDEFGFNHLGKSISPWVYDQFSKPSTQLPFVELPMAVVPKIRLPISLSYLKLLGWSPYRALFHLFGLPPMLVFWSHPYDYFPTSAMYEWNWKKYIHLRNIHRSAEIVTRFIGFLNEQGYEFAYMHELYEAVCRQAGVHVKPREADDVAK